MATIIRNINSLFDSFLFICYGDYKQNPEISNLKKEILSDIDIPTYKNDKQNLKSDFHYIFEDLRKSFSEYKSEKKIN